MHTSSSSDLPFSLPDATLRTQPGISSVDTLLKLSKMAGIHEDEFFLYNEQDFTELTRQCGIPIQQRVRLKRLHQALVYAGKQKPRPAVGFANLTDDALGAILEDTCFVPPFAPC